MISKGNRERPARYKREKGRAGTHVVSPSPPYHQAARTHARTETENENTASLLPLNLVNNSVRDVVSSLPLLLSILVLPRGHHGSAFDPTFSD